MSVRLGIVMDPIARISYKKDSSLAMLLAAQARGWSLFYLEQRDLYQAQGKARARMRPLKVFADYLGPQGSAYVQKPLPDSREALDWIARAGGVAAWAHPPRDASRRNVQTLVEQGLAALEVEGPGIPHGRVERLRGWAKELDLVAVAGSDFHAPDRPGRWIGSIQTPSEALEQLRERAKANPHRDAETELVG